MAVSQGLANRCFEASTGSGLGHYTYTLCVYQKVTQKENGGSHASVSLGKGAGAASKTPCDISLLLGVSV